MKISVVIPLYNKVRHIRRAVESVLGQTCPDFELVVIDDGSTDGSGDVVRQMTDPRIRLIVQPNAGECAARNRGIQEASGELIAFLDADDEWLPCFLETVTSLKTRFPDCGMYASAYSLSQGGNSVRPEFRGCSVAPEGGILGDYFEAALGPSPVTSSSVMIPKSVLQAVGGFPCGIRRGGDLATWAQIALRHPAAWSPVNGAIYHLAADNRACETQAVHHDLPGASIIEEYLKTGRETVSPRSKIQEYLVIMRLRLVAHYCLLGQKDVAFDLLAKTRGTVAHARRRRLLLCLSRVPSPILRAGVRLKAALGNVLKLVC